MNILCKKCNTSKDENLFYKTKSKTGFHHYCKDCCKIRWKEYVSNKECKRYPRGRKPYIEKATKFCRGCSIEKDIQEFCIRTTRKNGRVSRCKDCSAAQHKRWQSKNPNASRERNLKSKYGISEEDYKLLLENQNGCAICHTHKDQTHKNLPVDHCHATGKIRGILCSKCNIALGGFNDDIQLLKEAINYLNNNVPNM